MKNEILKITTFLLVLVIVNIACKKTDNKPLEMGIYVESYPEKERSKIYFVDENTLVIQKGYYDWSTNQIIYDSLNTFNYVISESDSTIWLTHVELLDLVPSLFYFCAINNRKFEIGNLYPGTLIIGTIRPIMTFEKTGHQ